MCYTDIVVIFSNEERVYRLYPNKSTGCLTGSRYICFQIGGVKMSGPSKRGGVHMTILVQDGEVFYVQSWHSKQRVA